MNKLYTILLAMLVAVGVLAGCGAQQEEQSNTAQEGEQTEATQEETHEVTAEVLITKNNGKETIAEEEVTVEEGTTLMEVMENNFEIEETDGFINSIEGISGNEEEKMAWMYTINGEDAMVGANEYELEDGDEIIFDYQSWE